jgi:hypothetical protein
LLTRAFWGVTRMAEGSGAGACAQARLETEAAKALATKQHRVEQRRAAPLGKSIQ